MKKFVFVLLIFGQIGWALPLSMTISNQELSIGFVATPLELNLGYPQTSISFERIAGIKINESTSLLSPYLNFNFYNYEFLSFFAGTSFQFGNLPQGFQSEKIKETGRIFLNLSTCMKLKNVHLSVIYERLISSVDLNVLNDIFFLAPPNPYYPPNAFYLYGFYDLNWFQKDNVTFRLFGDMNLNFSDALIFSTPSIEIGVTILTNTSILNR